MKKEFNLSEKRKEFKEDLIYALNKFDWGNSFLDAKAIEILNVWAKVLDEQDKEFIRLLKEFTKTCKNDYYDYRDMLSKIDKLAGKDFI